MTTFAHTDLPGVMTITPAAFEDHRGRFVETYNRELYAKNGIDLDFVQDDISISRQHVLRGIHGDDTTHKIVSCIEGELYFVVVNCDQDSPQFGAWLSFTLSETNRMQVLIPPKHGNGYLVLSKRAIFHYKQTTYYAPHSQFTYRYDDPRLGIWWPSTGVILSRRDDLGRRPEET